MHMWRGAVETNVQKMQVLLETVRAGSFTRAAERLSYSQSGVSRMVADLEADWGFKVLDRSREGVVLSADGRQVMPAVEALCEEFTRLQRRVDEMRGLMRGKICIGTFFERGDPRAAAGDCALSRRSPGHRLRAADG